MAGALAERVFAKKLTNAGFTDRTVLGRRPFSVDDAARYPLFTPDLIGLMRDLLPPEQQEEVGTVVMLTARKPDTDEEEPR